VAFAIDSVTTIWVLPVRPVMLPFPISVLPKNTWSIAPLSNPLPFMARLKLLAPTEEGLMKLICGVTDVGLFTANGPERARSLAVLLWETWPALSTFAQT
jgi:hypothetical protein